MSNNKFKQTGQKGSNLTILENLLEGCQIIDSEYRYLYINKTAAKQGKKTAEELLGYTMMEMYPGIETTPMFSVLRQSMQEKIHQEMENEFLFEDGLKGYYYLRFEPVQEGVLIMSKDITEQKKTEKALRESGELFRSIYENSILGIYRTTPEGKIIMVNPALVKILGFTTVEELLERDLKMEGFEPDSPRSEFKRRIEKEGIISDMESVWKDKNGKPVWLRESACTIYDEGGQPVYYDGVIENITGYKLEKESSSHYLQKITDQAPGAIYEFQITPDGVFSFPFISRGIEDIHPGLTAEMLSKDGSLGFSIIHPDDVKRVQSSIESSYKTLNRWDIEFRVIIDDGSIRWHRGNALPEKLEDGTVKWYGTFQDITERILAEEKIREREAEFRLIIESVSDYAIIMFDTKGNITRWNVGAEKLKGYKSDEIIGKHFSLFYTKEDIDKGKPEMELVKADAEGSFEDEGWRIRKDGSSFWANVIISAIRGKSGELIGYSKITRDLTQRKKAENWKQRQNDILETIGKNEPLSTTFELIVKSVEEEDPDSLCSILLLDKEGKHLLNAAAPSLPEFYIQAINGNEIGEKAGSCGAAAYSKKRVIAEDLLTHPNWEPYRELAQQANLRSCWSEPILDSSGNCLGTFAIYHRKPCVPQNEEIELLKSTAYLASLAIVHKQDEEKIRNINSGLEIVVEERTKQLAETNRSLYKEIEERKYLQDQFRIIVESAPNAIILVDSDGIIQLVNNQMESYFGYSRSELVGMKVDQLVPNEKRAGHSALRTSFMAHPKARNMGMNAELFGLRKDGSEIPIEVGLSSIHFNNNTLILVTIIDISFRKKAVDALRESEERLHLAANAGNIGIWDWDIEKNELKWDKNMYSLYGISRHNFKGDYDAWSKTLHPDDQQYVDEEIQAAIRGERQYAPEFRIISTNSDVRFIKADSKTFRDKEGKAIRMVGTNVDITEQMKIINEIKAAKTEADQANRAKSDFLARMSHEIRTPLNAIIGITHLTLHTELNKKQAENLKKVYSSATSLLSIINDILDFSKIEANKLELEQIEFDLEEVFRELTNVITYKALDKNLEIAFNLPRSVPNKLKGDPLRLGQILNNLSINAIKYTEKGEIVIKIELAEKKNRKVKLLFSVKDTGIGLSKEETLRLFKSFSQADVSTTRNYGGTGLGLAICKKLTEIMGGEIWVESTKGQGSTFFFTAWFGLGEQTKSKKFLVPADLRGLKALVCDDNETAREILREALETFKFDVTTVTSGKDALAELLKSSNEPYKLVLMDWIMPEMNGLQAAKLIMTNKKISTSPKIIMVTAFDREEVRTEAEETGIAGILIKPVGYSDLYNTILETFGKTAQIKSAEKKIHTISADILQQVHGALVLLVEDNDINQDVAVGILEEAGATAEIANNGKEAVRMVMASGKPSKYKLVLMDLRMPVMDGYDATIEIRNLKDYSDLPIIAMTADAISGIKEKCLKAGMNDFIAKPIDPKNFYNTLAQWITYSESNMAIKSKALNPTRLPEIDDTAKISEIKGLDTSDGLRRINNNTDLYLKMLGKFSKNYSTFINELKRSLEKGLIEESERMVHTLKGVSGNIGATDLHSFTVTLDDKLKKKEKIDIKSEMSDLGNFLMPILNSINQVLSKEEVYEYEHQKDLDVDIDTVQFKKLLNELSMLLEKSDFDSAKKADELKSIKGIGKYYEEIRKIRELISDYEFDEAKTILDKLIKID